MTDSPSQEVVERTNVFDNIVAQFIGAEDFDAEYVVKGIEDVRVRDALLHYVSDKYQISLYGDESTLEDCSITRKMFGAFLMTAGDEHEHTPMLYVTISALALLDGAPEAAEEMASNDLCKDVSLARLITHAVSHLGENASRVFKESVEENSIENSLIGANN